MGVFELRSDPRKVSIKFNTFEECAAMIQCVESQGKVLHLSGDKIPNEFDIDAYMNIIKSEMTPTFLIGYIILLNDLACIEGHVDYASLFYNILKDNSALVEQYKTGNDKALNALMGKFLKEHRGYDPKEVKTELINILDKL